jgi:hypothetical protein
MNFKQQLIEESKKLKYLERLQQDIEIIKAGMLEASDSREYTIYLTKHEASPEGATGYGNANLRIPNGVSNDTYCTAMLAALRDLGFDRSDFKAAEYETFYRIRLKW